MVSKPPRADATTDSSPLTTPPTLRIQPDAWLSGVLGRDVFAVTELPAPESAGAVGSVLLRHAADRTAMYFARVDTDRIDLVRALGAVGFYVVDVTVTLGRSGFEAPLAAPGDVGVRDLTPADHAAALQIAERSFRYSRFHLDPSIPPASAARVKREWIRSYVEGRRGERLMLAHRGGRVLGFLAVLAGPDDARTIDLIAVAPEAQGGGVGTALVAAFILRYTGRRLEVGTQAANIQSIAFYERCGFRVQRTRLVMHLHVGGSQ